MKNITNIFIPIAFLALCGFSIYNGNLLEATLYLFVGSGFSIINMIKSKVIIENLTFWNRLAWALVLLSGILFMAVLLNDANQEILNP